MGSCAIAGCTGSLGHNNQHGICRIHYNLAYSHGLIHARSSRLGAAGLRKLQEILHGRGEGPRVPVQAAPASLDRQIDLSARMLESDRRAERLAVEIAALTATLRPMQAAMVQAQADATQAQADATQAQADATQAQAARDEMAQSLTAQADELRRLREIVAQQAAALEAPPALVYDLAQIRAAQERAEAAERRAEVAERRERAADAELATYRRLKGIVVEQRRAPVSQ